MRRQALSRSRLRIAVVLIIAKISRHFDLIFLSQFVSYGKNLYFTRPGLLISNALRFDFGRLLSRRFADDLCQTIVMFH